MARGDFERRFDRLFNPRTVATVGASNIPGKWGFNMPMNMLGGGYRGELYMVNPRGSSVLGLPTFARITDIPGEVDLVIIAIPARKIPGVLEEAAAKGVRNVIIVASNFSEVGSDGVRLERHIADIANAAEMTIVGPNTMGVFSATSSLCALGAPVFPVTGSVGFISQSGNMGVQLMNMGKKRGIGFSRFVGSGNEANTEMSDFLEFLGDDPHTQTILLYIEGIDDGQRFLEVARRITPHKPIIALKAGKGKQGREAAQSHSGAMAGSIELFEGMAAQAGIIPADTTEELVDLAAAFSSLPMPRGNRVAVMTMGGGWGVVAADACDREGLELAVLPDSLIDELDTFLPQFWSGRNPVDIVGNVKRTNHFRVIDMLSGCEQVDILVVLGTLLGKGFFIDNMLNTALRPFYHFARLRTRRLPSFMRSVRKGFLESFTKSSNVSREGSGGIDPSEFGKWTDSVFIRRIRQMMERDGKPIIAVSITEEETASRTPGGTRLFTAPTPERAVRVAGKLAAYSQISGSGGQD